MALKRQGEKNSISKGAVEKSRGGNCPQFPAFSFAHMTRDKSHTFDYFKKSRRERHEALESLYRRLIELSESDWRHWHQQEKGAGLEVLSYGAVKFSPREAELTPDENIYVFRFSRGDCRILGYRKEKCPTLYIIGFDFNYSAYNHGS